MNHLWRIEMLGALRAVPNPLSVPNSPTSIERFRTQKTASLLAYLAFHHKPQPREILIDMIWPESDPRTGSQNLRTALSSLRRQLEPPGVAAGAVVLANHTHVQLHPQSIVTDVKEFDTALREGKAAFDREFQIENLERAIGLYSGRLLPGFFDDWVLAEAERLETEYFSALKRVIAHHEQLGDRERALYFFELGAAADDLHEVVEDARERLGVSRQPAKPKPRKSKEPVRKFIYDERFAADLETSAMPAREKAPRVQLPPQFTRFFGREAEIERVLFEFQQHESRLVTLTGAGGAGKTRLAIEAARRYAALGNEHGDEQENQTNALSVIFVPLADIRSSALIAPAIVDALELPHAREIVLSQAAPPEVFPIERISGALQSRPTLLVLDNFEHVASAAPLLKTLLAHVPSLKILVTSQQRLFVAGEREITVGALPVPDESSELTELLCAPSVQLFVDRAQLARPDFQITPGNAPDVARLCVALEGVPLAIELAAARAGVLSPRQIATQLEAARECEGQRLDFLHNTKKPATPRHLSLRTAIAWSYHLLPPDLARFWTSLAVFRGSFSLEAAEAVCRQPGVIHMLGQLRASSLLVVEDRNGEARFRWPELLREYATEVLLADEERAREVYQLHAEYFSDLLADSVQRLRTPDESGALQQAAVEVDNARAALEWASSADKTALAASLALSLGTTLQRRGLHAEALQHLEHGVEIAQTLPAEYDPVRAGLLREAAGVHLDLMQPDHAQRDAGELRKITRSIGDRKGVAEAINLLGLAAKSQRHWKRAREYFARAAASFEELGDCVGLGNAHNNLGLIEYLDERGDKQAATDHFREALRLRFELNDARGVAEAFINLGALAQQRGEFEGASRYYREALGIEQRLQHLFGIGRALCNLGETTESSGAFEAAFRLFIAAQCLFEHAGIAYQKYSASCADRLAGQITDAEHLRARAHELVEHNRLGELIEWAAGPHAV